MISNKFIYQFALVLFLSQISIFNIIAQTADNYPGSALDFDGTDDYVELASSAAFNSSASFSVELWLKPQSMTGSHIVAQKGADWTLRIFEDPSKSSQSFAVVEFGINDNAQFSQLTISTASELIDQWVHICGVVDRSSGNEKLLVYVNGVAGSLVSNPAAITTGGSNIRLGESYPGIMDEVRIWNTALSEQQIRENQHLTQSASAIDLYAYIQFNEGSGSTAADATSNNHDGSLNNMNTSTCWLSSDGPFGGGSSNTQTEANGLVTFSGTDLSMNFSQQNGASITVTRIELAPNNNPVLFDSQYWVVNRFGSGNFEADLTFTVSEDITNDDAGTPSRIKLFSRASNSDDNWQNTAQASSADAANEQASFSDISGFSQFSLGRRLPAEQSSGYTLNFGSGDYISSSDIPSQLEAVSLEAWVYAKSLPGSNNRIITLAPEDAVIRHCGAEQQGQLHFYIKKKDGNLYGIRVDNTLKTNEWMHVCGTYDGSEMKVYCNGILLDSNTPNDGLYPPNGTMEIGASGESWDGYIDEVRVWDHARSEEEIQNYMYATLSGLEEGLISYYQLNEGTGSSTINVIGGGSGSLNNLDNSDWISSTAPVPYQSESDGSWASSGTWQSGQGVPTRSWSRVSVNNDLSLSDDVILKYLNINADASLSIDNAALTVTDSMDNAAGTTGLVINSASSGDATLIHNEPNIDATAKRYVNQSKWHYVSAPVIGQEISEDWMSNNSITNSPPYQLFRWDEPTNYWIIYSSDGIPVIFGDTHFGSAKGYVLTTSADHSLSFSGTLLAENISLPLTFNSDKGNGFHIIGNPFPCPIGITEDSESTGNFIAANSGLLDPDYQAIYLWNEEASYEYGADQYAVICNAGYSGPDQSSAISQDYIGLGQAFMVKVKESGNIAFDTNMRSHQNATFYKNQESWPGITLYAHGESGSSRCIIAFDEQMTYGLDRSYDVAKITSNQAISLYSRLVNDNGNKFAVQSIPLETSCRIPLGIDVKNRELIKFSQQSLGLDDYSIYLEDNILNTLTDLKESEYSVEVNTPLEERFFLHIYKTTALPPENQGNQIKAYCAHGQIIIINQSRAIIPYFIYDISGRLIEKGSAYPQRNIIRTKAKKGVYLIHCGAESSICILL